MMPQSECIEWKMNQPASGRVAGSRSAISFSHILRTRPREGGHGGAELTGPLTTRPGHQFNIRRHVPHVLAHLVRMKSSM